MWCEYGVDSADSGWVAGNACCEYGGKNVISYMAASLFIRCTTFIFRLRNLVRELKYYFNYFFENYKPHRINCKGRRFSRRVTLNVI
jgi:hypothetical protein